MSLFAFRQRLEIEDSGVGRGGFEVLESVPPGARAIHTVRAGDPGPGGWQRDYLKEAREGWIVLHPGEFYGGRVPLRSFLPLSTGRYKLVAKWHPPSLTEKDKEQLRSGLKFPPILDAIESPP